MRTDSGEAAILLEAPFDFARWRVQAALQAHWRQPAPRPLPGEFRLYAAGIWQYAPPSPDPALAACYAAAAATPTLAPCRDRQLIDTVLSHPAFAGWSFLPRGMIEQLRVRNLPVESLPAAEFVQLILGELDKRPEGEQILALWPPACRRKRRGYDLPEARRAPSVPCGWLRWFPHGLRAAIPCWRA